MMWHGPAGDEYVQPTPDGGTCRFPARLPGERLCARLRAEGCTARTLHHGCFLGFLALRLGVATVDEVLGDFGLVHEIAHHLHLGPRSGPQARTVEEIAVLAERIERGVRDLLPRHGSL